MLRRLVLSCASIALTLALSPSVEWAQSYPTKPVTAIDPGRPAAEPILPRV